MGTKKVDVDEYEGEAVREGSGDAQIRAPRKKVEGVEAEVRRGMGHLDLRSGPATDSYERYVRRIFTPGDFLRRNASGLAAFSDVATELNSGNPIPDIPPSLLLKMEKMELAEDLGTQARLFSPLEMMERLYGQYGLEDSKYANFPVYQTKSSSEYFSVMNNNPRVGYTPSFHYKVARTANAPNVFGTVPREDRYHVRGDGQRRFLPPSAPHHLLIDYDSFSSNPISPYLYGRNFHREDSRIHGSNFIMVKNRPADPFLNRIDQVLELAKKC